MEKCGLRASCHKDVCSPPHLTAMCNSFTAMCNTFRFVSGKKNGTPSLAKQNFDGDVCFVQRRQLYEWNEAWRKRFVLETNLRTTTFQRSNNHLNLQQMQGTNRALFHTRHKDMSCTYCQVTQNESCVKAQAPEVSIN